ncbi:DUF294 nucleotidyltransferase-like domain-containing protein [Thiomicrorhabdus indica]|uniref:DUF294 nucleotidyltransferase-like domain-containing protein n=1 Tax=Thiomicrorhabdus indica TaxID=2267253 RepID=UPI002AA85C71|nr:DUF294 nucleotidyltransferase-like domain-containing protein [Thiomicrorhabdus indica]
MALIQQREFLSKITPFTELPNDLLNQLADSMDIVYLPERTEITFQNELALLYILIKGKVTEYRDEEVTSHYSVRGFFGDSVILEKSQSQVKFVVDEEAIAYKLPAGKFLHAFKKHEAFADFFNASIVEKLNRIHETQQTATSTEVMMDTVISAPIQKLVSVTQKASILEATQAMTDARSDACLVEFSEGESGIITSTDILKFVALGETDRINAPSGVQSICNRPVYSVHEFDYLFNALLKMTRFQIDRLAVRSDLGFVGFLHQKDLMSLFANQSGLVLTKVEKSTTVEDLIGIGEQVDAMVHNLNRKGIKTHYIAKLVNELHRKMIAKLVEFILPETLQEKVCLFVMGSEGRSEQVIRTDQDNALIYDNELNAEQLTQLHAFTKAFTENLMKMGFPPCPGNIMLSNPEWCQSQASFSQTVEGWFDESTEGSFMNAAILFDAEFVFGQSHWLNDIKRLLVQQNVKHSNFLRHFAIQSLKFNTPVGFFGGLIADSESGIEVIDIKKGGIFSIVHGIRCYALELGIKVTNTHWRIKALMDAGVFEQEFGIELGETLNFLNTLRLESMLHQLDSGVELPDNKIRLAELSHMQQDLLKQSFNVVDVFKKRLSHHFGLNGML